MRNAKFERFVSQIYHFPALHLYSPSPIWSLNIFQPEVKGWEVYLAVTTFLSSSCENERTLAVGRVFDKGDFLKSFDEGARRFVGIF